MRRPPRATLLPYTTLFRSFRPPAGGRLGVPEQLDRIFSPGDLPGDEVPIPDRVLRGARGEPVAVLVGAHAFLRALALDRKSTRLNSSHGYISYAVFCLKKK